jgi:hypothetical protein
MQNKTFFASLFDTSFTSFVTTHWIKFLFIVNVIFAAIPPACGCLFALTLITKGFFGLIGAIFLIAILGMIFILEVIAIRLYLEFAIVAFRIEEHTRFLAQRASN